MSLETVLLVLLAVVISATIVIFQYTRSGIREKKYYRVLVILRFLALLALFLLLINPKVSRQEYTLEKSDLIVLADNSRSIRHLNMEADVLRTVEEISGSEDLSDKYDIRVLNFGKELNLSDSLLFDEGITNINGALRSVSTTYDKPTALVLVTDGNQTIGADYEFLDIPERLKVFPVVVGDTTAYEDLQIAQVNVNKYAFLDNQYPLEILLRYQGGSEVTTSVMVKVDGSTSHRELITFNKQNNARRVEVLLRANTVGIKLIEIELGALPDERNTVNNVQNVAVEVIDEKTEVAIIADMNHPDLGVLKKSIESNNQRSASIIRPGDRTPQQLEEIDVFILYQPSRSFDAIYKQIQDREMNYMTITGPNTDWDYLNQVQNSFTKNSYDQSENITPLLNAGFSTFDVSELAVDDYPPLNSLLGDLLIARASDVLMEQRIRGVATGDPLITLIRDNTVKEVLVFGENIWKWRMQTYRENNSFEAFDNLIGKIMLFLSSDEARQRLSVEYENIYRDANNAYVRASYFDETYEFDPNATLTLYLSSTEESVNREFPILPKGGYYEADLSGLPAGTFEFRVGVEGSNLSRSGQFTILDFDVEQQFSTAQYGKLDRLAQNAGGKLYFPDQTAGLIADLEGNTRFRPTQKSEQNVVSLIDFKTLLGLLAALFAAEWFIRKFNGLI